MATTRSWACTRRRARRLPLYPLGLRSISWLGVPPVLAGVLLSLAALALAVYDIHRLTSLELGTRARIDGKPAGADRVADAARLAVMLPRCSRRWRSSSRRCIRNRPYLALSVGLFLSARRGRWMWVGVLGALAGATRSTGPVLALPALMLYVYGPREDRPAHFDVRGRPLLGRLRPRYRLRGDVLWLGLLPVGVVLYGAFLGLSGGDPLAPLHAEGVWGRHFVGPYVGVWDGVKAAVAGARQSSFQSRHVYFPAAAGSPSVAAGHNLCCWRF